jgi:DNA mismatch repair protein MutS
VHLDATEHGEDLVFLHAVREGPANRSFGLQVARLAGVPADVLAEASRYLAGLERRDHAANGAHGQQWLPLDPAPDPAEATVRAELSALDPDSLSPREAHAALYRLRELLGSR